MNKKSLFLRIIGILFIFIPFVINIYNSFRFISLLLGILILCLESFLFKKINVVKILFYPILLLISAYGLDYASVSFLHRVPIFSYKNVVNSQFFTYDSILYRIYDCNGKQTIDPFYQSNYICDFSLEAKNINSFLNDISSNYSKYHSKFVTIQGKVSEVFGNEYLSLHPYEQKDSLVGQISFNKNATLKIVNNHKNLKLYGNYEIYDTVLVTGRITSKNGQEIIMQDAKIDIMDNFDQFIINVVETKSCKEKLKELTQVDNLHYYSNCLNEIFVKYEENTIYDLILALETKKLTFDKWVEKSTKEENEEKELYKFTKYHLLKCKDSNTIVIGNNTLKLNSKICKNFSIPEKENEKKEKIE